MIHVSVINLLTEQVNAEFYSSYLYLQMSIWLSHKGYPGAASWMKTQAKEELSHGMKILGYCEEQGQDIDLYQIETPRFNRDSILDIFKEAWDHEQIVTAKIHKIFKTARENGDYASEVFLQWFVNEQVEEESVANDILSRITYIYPDPAGVAAIDRELGQRQ